MKCRSVIFFLFSLGKSILIFAQSDSIVIAVKNGIGLTGGPLFSVPINKPSNSQNLIKGQLTWAGGVSGNFLISKKRNVFLCEELGYLQNSQIEKHIPNSASIIDSMGNINYSRLSYFDQIEKLNYIYFSTLVNKTIFKLPKKFFLLGGAGLRASYFYSDVLESKNATDYYGRNDNYKFHYSGTDIKQHYTAALLGRVGILKNFSDKFSFIIASQFAYELSPVSFYLRQGSLAGGERSFYNLGINFQLLYSF